MFSFHNYIDTLAFRNLDKVENVIMLELSWIQVEHGLLDA